MNDNSKITKQILFLAVLYFVFIGVLFVAYRAGRLLRSDYIFFIAVNSMHGYLYEYKILNRVNGGLSLVLIVLVLFFVKG
jgi:cbb3-type cytochrome oxidase subunit 3